MVGDPKERISSVSVALLARILVGYKYCDPACLRSGMFPNTFTGPQEQSGSSGPPLGRGAERSASVSTSAPDISFDWSSNQRAELQVSPEFVATPVGRPHQLHQAQGGPDQAAARGTGKDKAAECWNSTCTCLGSLQVRWNIQKADLLAISKAVSSQQKP